MDLWYEENKEDLHFYFDQIINTLQDEEINIKYDNKYMFDKYLEFIYKQNYESKKIITSPDLDSLNIKGI